MAYQLKRTEKLRDELELCDEGGNVTDTLHFTVDIDSISGELRKRLTDVISAEKALKNAIDDKQYTEAYGSYGEAITGIFAICFGSENARKIAEHYENNFIEMSLAVVPYIYEVVLPKVNECIAKKREEMKNLYRTKTMRFGKR